MSRSDQALACVVAWGLALVLLAVVWIRSPFTGPGPMFLGWSSAALVLTAGTVAWLNRLGDRHVPRGSALLSFVALAWVAAAWASMTTLGAELALDGLILRRPGIRAVGVGRQPQPQQA